MPDPVLSPLGQRLRERTAPLAPNDPDNGFAHAHLAEAMMLPFKQVAELIDPPDPYEPWEVMFHVDLCPEWALPWLGQIVGVRVPKWYPEAEKRAYIKALGGFRRGGPDAIREAVAITLIGAKSVILRERDAGEAYKLEVITDVDDTPDPARTQRMLAQTVPAAILLTFRSAASWDYQGMTLAGGTYAQLTTKFHTYREMALNEPR